MATRDEGAQLVERGFVCGSLFAAPGSSYVTSQRNEKGDFDPAAAKSRRTKPKERLVVISHACDIISEQESYIEALICKPEDPTNKRIHQIARYDPRHFLVDPDTAWVAWAEHRVKILKEALFDVAIEKRMDSDRNEDFKQWLALRYGRTEVPDAVHDHFSAPVTRLLDKLEDSGNPHFTRMNQCLRQLRIGAPEDNNPDRTVRILYLTKDIPTADEDGAIRAVHSMISDLVAEHFSVPPPMISKYADIPYGFILGTEPLMVDYLSHPPADTAPPIRPERSRN